MPKLFSAVGAVGLAMLALAGCGSSNSSSSSTTGTTSTTATPTVDASDRGPGARGDQIEGHPDRRGPKRSTRRTSSSPPTATRSIGMDADLVKALGAVMGLKASVVNATFDTIIPGLAGRQVRPRRVVVHRHQGTREDRRLRQLLHGRAVVLREDHGGPNVNSLARPLRHRPCPSRKGPRARRSRRRRPQSAHRKARSGRPCSSFPARRGQPRARQRTRGNRHGRLAGRRLPGQAVGRRGSSASADATAPRPTGSRCRRTTAWPSPMLAALKELMANGAYAAILKKWGRRRAAAISNPAINGATELSRQRRCPGVMRAPTPPGGLSEIKAVPVRHPGRWVAAALIVLVIASR